VPAVPRALLARLLPLGVVFFTALQVALAVAPGAGLGRTTALALKVALAAALLWLVGRLVLAMARGSDLGPLPWPAAAGRLTPGPWTVLTLSGAVLALALYDQPARLALTLYCFLLLGGVSWWVVRRGAGGRAAGAAVLGLAALCLVGATAQRPSMRFMQDWAPQSEHRWAVGWPTESWRLSHALRLPPGAVERPLRLRLFLAGPYRGPARIYATVNGQEVSATLAESELQVDVPPAVIQGAEDLQLVLRQAPVDPRLRLQASRWAQGASMGRAATGYSDGAAWLRGTFNDAAGQAQPGVLALHVEGLE
jgi:hypothetical protein